MTTGVYERPIRFCSISDCGKRHYSLGYCLVHYQRLKRHGDPLAGGAVITYRAALDFYRGTVLPYDGNDCLFWPFSRSKAGYGNLKVAGGGSAILSRRLCEEVHGPAPTPMHEAAHSCGKGHLGCVTKSHLSWKTPSENAADKILHGTTNRGERCGSAKLTEPDVLEIRALRGQFPQTVIAKRYGVSRPVVSTIQSGKSWAWLANPQIALIERKVSA